MYVSQQRDDAHDNSTRFSSCAQLPRNRLLSSRIHFLSVFDSSGRGEGIVAFNARRCAWSARMPANSQILPFSSRNSLTIVSSRARIRLLERTLDVTFALVTIRGGRNCEEEEQHAESIAAKIVYRIMSIFTQAPFRAQNYGEARETLFSRIWSCIAASDKFGIL